MIFGLKETLGSWAYDESGWLYQLTKPKELCNLSCNCWVSTDEVEKQRVDMEEVLNSGSLLPAEY